MVLYSTSLIYDITCYLKIIKLQYFKSLPVLLCHLSTSHSLSILFYIFSKIRIILYNKKKNTHNLVILSFSLQFYIRFSY